MISCSSSTPSNSDLGIDIPGGGGGVPFCFEIVTLAADDTSRNIGDMACGLSKTDDYDGDGVPNMDDGTESATAGDSGNFATQASDGYYEIANIYQLQAIMSFQTGISLSDRLSANYRLIANVNAINTTNSDYDADFDGSPDPEGFLSIGDNTNRFTGNFDGNGHRISNLTINRPSTNNVGLFGVSENSTIENVHLENVNITANSRSGALVGYKIGGSISGSSAEGSLVGEAQSGGLVGKNTGAVQSSFANVSVSGQGDGRGALIGYNTGAIQNCYAAGRASTISDHDNLGGLIGRNTGNIQSSFASGDAWGQNTLGGSTNINNVGGLVGYNNGSIQNSYAIGQVRGKDHVGGLAGYNDGVIQNSYATGRVLNLGEETGGLVGNNDRGVIERSYAAGAISSVSKNRTGGLIGGNKNVAITAGPIYFAARTNAAGSGSNGLGWTTGGSAICNTSICIEATGSDYNSRYAWLEDSLDETLDSGLNWDDEVDAEGNAVWGNLGLTGFPCLRNMPTGSPECN